MRCQLRQAWSRDRSYWLPSASIAQANEPDVLTGSSKIHTLGRNDAGHYGHCIDFADARWTTIHREGIERYGEDIGQASHQA